MTDQGATTETEISKTEPLPDDDDKPATDDTATPSLLQLLGLAEFSNVDYTPFADSPILSIHKSDEFNHTFSLLYALEANNELSARALRLTSAAIKLNAGNPTVWLYRRRIITHLAEDDTAVWERELGFTAKVIQSSRKNYQAWEHRRYCVRQAGRLSIEAQFVDIVLDADAKNYHAWAHRAWLVDQGVTEGERAVCEWLIRDDVRNNSAWNHLFVVGSIIGREGDVQFACEMAGLAARNESVWNFLLAVGRDGCNVQPARQLARECIEQDSECVAARRFLVLNAGKDDAEEVVEQCRVLAELDDVRYKYWRTQGEAAERLVTSR